MDKESTTIKESLGKSIEVTSKELKGTIKANKEKTDEAITVNRTETKTIRINLSTNSKAISKEADRVTKSISTQKVTADELEKQKELSNSMTLALIERSNALGRRLSEVNTTVNTAQGRFNAKMVEIRESLAQFRAEADVAHTLIREQTDTAIDSIETATQASLALVQSEANATNIRITKLEKYVNARAVPDFMIGTFLKDCPAGWVALDGHDIPDEESFSVLYFEDSNYPDLRGRYMMMKDDSTDLLQKLRNTTAVNGLHMGWGGIHNQQKYGQTSIHEGSSLAGLTRFNSVLYATYTTGNHYHSLYGDPKTRPDTIVVNKCFKLKPKE